MRKVRLHVFISGIVQGVGFRYSLKRVAISNGVKGWVKNLRDGRVEAVLEGDEDSVRRVLAWCRRGPSLARVDKVEAFEEQYRGEFKGFEIRWW